jgi:hypothetical protein
MLDWAKQHNTRVFLGLWVGTSNSSNEQVLLGASKSLFLAELCFWAVAGYSGSHVLASCPSTQELGMLPQLLQSYSSVISTVAVGNEAVSLGGELPLFSHPPACKQIPSEISFFFQCSFRRVAVGPEHVKHSVHQIAACCSSKRAFPVPVYIKTQV